MEIVHFSGHPHQNTENSTTMEAGVLYAVSMDIRRMQSDESEEENSPTDEKAFCAGFPSVLLDKDNWYFDSKHLTMREDWMVDRKFSEIKEIIVANNSKLPVKAAGKVYVNVDCGGEANNAAINNAQLVPDLSANLLSVSQSALNGYTITFDKSGCRIINDAGDFMCHSRVDQQHVSIGFGCCRIYPPK